MSPLSVETPLQVEGPSLAKQRVLTQYATGELTWQQATQRLSEIRPPLTARTWRHAAMMFFVSVLLAFLVPPHLRRENN